MNLILIFTVIGIGMRAYYKSNNIVAKKVVMAALLGFITSVVHGLFNSFLDQDKIASLVFTSMAIIVAVDLSTRKIRLQMRRVYNFLIILAITTLLVFHL